MKRTILTAFCLGFALCVSPAVAAEAVPVADNPQLEAQVRRVTEGLRCLVCQNQTIADSHAGLAQDLRREVRTMLAQGKSEAQVREFMVNRYGDFILYRPPFKLTTLLLWLGPFVLLFAALWIHRRTVVGRTQVHDSVELSEADQARLQSLIGADHHSGRT